MPLAFRPHDPYHEYAAEEWDSTDVDSDSPKSLLEEGKLRCTILSKYPPTTEVVEDPVLLREFIAHLYVLRWELYQELESPSPSSTQPPAPVSLHVTPSPTAAPLSDFPSSPTTSTPSVQPASLVLPPASSNPSDDVSPIAHSRDSKRSRKDSDSSYSDSGLLPQNKRLRSGVLQPISNFHALPSSSVLLQKPSQAPEATANPDCHAPLPATQPKQRRRTAQDLQEAVKAHPSTDKSHICQIGECKEPLLCDNLQESRDHIRRHYVGTIPPSLSCLRPGCSLVCSTVDAARRHFETHLPWVFLCPNVVRGCTAEPFSRQDA